MNQPLTAKMAEYNISEKTHKRVKPFYIKKLLENFKTHNEVGDLIGISGSTVSAALRDDDINYTTELAAKCVYESLVGKSDVVTAIIQHDRNSMLMVETLIKNTSGSFQIIGGLK